MKDRPMSRGVIWSTRRDLKGCYVRVATEDQESIEIYVPHLGGYVFLDRGEARLLAKRINQCLDETVRK